MKYSATTGGFYAPEFDYNSLPADVVEITDDHYNYLIGGQSGESEILPDGNGVPQLVAVPQPSPAELLAKNRAAQMLTRFQFRSALHQRGLLMTATGLIAACPDFLVAEAFASELRLARTSRCVVWLASRLWPADTEEALDALFTDGALITA